MSTIIRILAINGSYREDGITDQTVEALAQAIKAAGAEVEVIRMIAREQHPKLPEGVLPRIKTLAGKLV
jgi:NAD(P)H-dependent FMN reductase